MYDFILNGRPYNEALAKFLKPSAYLILGWAPRDVISKDTFPGAVFWIIGLSRTNTDKNPYIHTASQIIKSLATFSDQNWAGSPSHHYCHFHHSQWRLSATCLPPYFQSLMTVCQREQHHVKSGRIYRIGRERRLMNFKHAVRGQSQEYSRCRDWNCTLISQFLVPILDKCPKSDKLLALIKRRIGYVCVRYTDRRRLMDAAYKYIRRTSDVANN